MAMCNVDELSSVDAVEQQLDVIQSLRNDVEAFAQKMKNKLSGMEDALQKQVEDLSDTVANEQRLAILKKPFALSLSISTA